MGFVFLVIRCTLHFASLKARPDVWNQMFGTKFPLPFQGNVQIPPFPGTIHSQMPGSCPGGGVLKLQFDRYIIKVSPEEVLLKKCTDMVLTVDKVKTNYIHFFSKLKHFIHSIFIASYRVAYDE